MLFRKAFSRKRKFDEAVKKLEEIDEEKRKVEEEKRRVKEEKRKIKRKDYDLPATLAMYIVCLEILIASYFKEDDEFLKLYELFRKDYDIERLINEVVPYDKLFVAGYPEVSEWLKKVLRTE